MVAVRRSAYPTRLVRVEAVPALVDPSSHKEPVAGFVGV
jgi:hypothetical protein